MTAAQRRSAIYEQLTRADAPISATALAQRFSVTRQVVVGDIALLRAEGHRITATPRGYMIPSETGLLRTIACHHSGGDTQKELFAMVALVPAAFFFLSQRYVLHHTMIIPYLICAIKAIWVENARRFVM